MFNWLSESCVAHVCFEVVFAIVVAFFDRCFFRPSFIFVSVVSFSFCMHAAAAAVRFSSSDAKLCVCVNSVHWVCDIYYVWWWKRFVYFMYAQNNKQQQQGKLSSESFTQKSAKNTKMRREKKWKTATKNNGNSNKIENDSELSEKESHFHTHTHSNNTYMKTFCYPWPMTKFELTAKHEMTKPRLRHRSLCDEKANERDTDEDTQRAHCCLPHTHTITTNHLSTVCTPNSNDT